MSELQNEQTLSIQEEYDLWKSNVPLMYDFVSETRLLWPSLTMQWLPSDGPSAKQQMILGTHTSGSEQNYLKIASIDLPKEVSDGIDVPLVDGGEEVQQAVQSRIKINKKIPHEEEVTRARYSPKSPNIVASINGHGKVFLFDITEDSEKALRAELCFHRENGYGLAFSGLTAGELLSGSDDGTVALWDTCAIKVSSPVKVITSHTDIVNDCKWHEFDENLFGSVSEDKHLMIHDKRQNGPTCSIEQSEPFNTIAFSKHSRNLFAAAGTDSLIYLFDLRNTSNPLHSMSGHQDSVTSLEFSPHRDGILCSSGTDRRVLLWNLDQIGAEIASEDADDGVSELMMMHAGHKSGINDFSFNPNIPWLMGSAEEENIVHVWKVSEKITELGHMKHYDINSLE